MRDQIASMAEAAQGRASEIERNARESAESARREAVRSATEVVQGIGAVERELASLLRSISHEADNLRAKLDRARLLSRFGEPWPAMPAIEGEAITMEQGLPAPPEADPRDLFPAGVAEPPAEPASPDGEESPADDQGPDLRPADGSEARAPAADVHPDSVQTQAEATADPEEERPAGSDVANAPERTVTDQALPSPGAHENAGTLDEGAQWRVKRSTDLQLAEIHRIATMRLAESTESTDPPRRYWAALQEATIEEAARRPHFGRPGEGEDVGGRRAKKERNKALKPLMDARGDVLARRQWAEAPNTHGRDTVP